MNQTNFDLDTKENNLGSSKEQFSNFLTGLGAYFSVVFMSVSSLIILIAIFSGPKTIAMAGLLLYLAISLLFLVSYSAITTRTVSASISYRLKQIIKRFIDVVLAAGLIFVLAPVFIVISIAIRMESPGPIIYKEKRVGQFGKLFDIYKFRTMKVAPSRQPVTRIGKFLRETKLNSMPMLINILIGEMSMVGPIQRPPEILEKTLDPEGKILTVKPGFIGLFQISVSTRKDLTTFDIDWKEVIRFDLEYVQNWSLALDLKNLVQNISRRVSGFSERLTQPRSGRASSGTLRGVHPIPDKVRRGHVL